MNVAPSTYRRTGGHLRELPFPKLIGPRDRKDLVGLVDRMNALQKELRSTKSEHQREVTNRMVSEVDRQIDALVVRLFSVNETVSFAGAEVANHLS